MTGTTTYPGLFLDPVYVWGNTGGTNYNALQLTNFGIDQCGNGLSSAQFIVSGRDVFLGTVNPGYTFTYPHPFTRRFSTANSSASAYTYTNACVCYTGSFVDTISNHHQFELYFGIRNVDLGGG